MITLGKYQGSNLPLFQEFEMDLNIDGISIIRGVNKNLAKGQERNNGSGKSLLLSGIAEILMNCNPGIVGNETLARRALFPYDDSLISLEVDGELIAKGRFGRQPISYAIETESGLEQVKKEVAYEHLQSKFTQNIDIFQSLIFLDGGVDNTLIVGTPTQRIQFLSNVFCSLGIFDTLFQHFSDKLKVVNAGFVKKYTLEEELESLKQDSPESEKIVTKEQVLEAKRKRNVANKKLKEVRDSLSNMELQASYAKWSANAESLTKELGLKYIPTALWVKEDIERKDSLVRDKLSHYDKYVKALKENTRDMAIAEKHKTSLERSDIDDSRYHLIKLGNKQADTFRVYAESIANWVNEMCEGFKLPFRIKPPDTPYDYSLLRDFIPSLNFYLSGKRLIKSQSSSSPFKVKQDRNFINYADKISTALTMLDKLETSGVIISELQDPLSPEEKEALQTAHSNRIHLEECIEHIEKLKLNRRYLEENLERYSYCAKVNTESFMRKVELLEKLHTNLATMESVDVKVSGKVDKKSIQELSKKEKRLVSLSEKWGRTYHELKQSYLFQKENKSNLDKMQETIESLQVYEDAVPVVELLKKAFSTNGIRTQVLQGLVSELMDSMNKYSHLVFPESIQFSCTVDKRTCDIYAIRNPKTKYSTTSDIRLLSRSEKKSFTLLLLYCLLPRIPSEERFNIVVLDEMTSNMDSQTKTKVFRDFIPALKELVPHIIIADTGILELDDAIEYNVVKHKDSSILEKVG